MTPKGAYENKYVTYVFADLWSMSSLKKISTKCNTGMKPKKNLHTTVDYTTYNRTSLNVNNETQYSSWNMTFSTHVFSTTWKPALWRLQLDVMSTHQNSDMRSSLVPVLSRSRRRRCRSRCHILKSLLAFRLSHTQNAVFSSLGIGVGCGCLNAWPSELKKSRSLSLIFHCGWRLF